MEIAKALEPRFRRSGAGSCSWAILGSNLIPPSAASRVSPAETRLTCRNSAQYRMSRLDRRAHGCTLQMHARCTPRGDHVQRQAPVRQHPTPPLQALPGVLPPRQRRAAHRAVDLRDTLDAEGWLTDERRLIASGN